MSIVSVMPQLFFRVWLFSSYSNLSVNTVVWLTRLAFLSLQAFLVASSKEVLIAALKSASEITSDEPLERFSRVLTS
jgi:hypothetical protein